MTTPGALASLQIAEEHLLLHQRLQPEDIPAEGSSFCTAFISLQHPQKKEVVFHLCQVLDFPLVYGCTIFSPK